MKAPKLSKNDVGGYITDEKGNLFKIISFTSRPTFTIEKLNTNERETFVVGANNTEHLSKLIKEEK